MHPGDDVILRGGAADGQVVRGDGPGSAVSWEDEGGGAITYVPTGATEVVDGVELAVYRVER